MARDRRRARPDETQPDDAGLRVAGAPVAGPPVLAVVALLVGFVGVAVWQVAPALDGEFLSDDYLYIVNNAYVHEISWENVRAILDPDGQPTAYTLNYAPVHLLLHAVQWEWFGGEHMLGWHLTNAIAHGLTSLLLVAFLMQAGIGRAAALFGGAFFLVHPANVETVAWIFQLKTIVALALSLGALMAHPRRPGLAVLLFGLALLTKITAVAVLPVAILQAWIRAGRGEPARFAWLAGWALVAIVIGVLEMTAFQIQADPRLVVHEDPLVHARSIVAFAMRYLVMAATSWGVSTYQNPEPAVSWLDPWWLTGLVALLLLGARTVVTLRRRDEEAAFWVLAAASFAPVSQIFPFIYPVADRYLYGILPGLLGGVLLVARGPAARLHEAIGARAGGAASWLRPAVAVVACALLLGFALRSEKRAVVFRTNWNTMIDAAMNYPDGLQAALLKGHRAALEGDAPRAAAAFQRAVDLGLSDLGALVTNPSLARVRAHPAFQQMLRNLAALDIARLKDRENAGQSERMALGLAYAVHGDKERAIHAYESALESGGPFDDLIRSELRQLRR